MLQYATPSSGPGRRFAYADPPYPGLAKKYYGDQPTYAGEVDHAALIASLEASGYTGWALSTSARALGDVLRLCPPGARVAAWVKPIGVPATTYGMHSTWEPVIVVGGRKSRPGVRDWLRAMPARGGGTLPGRKPIAFCAWLFDLLGMVPGDTIDDLFPGTGIVARSWKELSARSSESPGYPNDASGMSRRRLLASVVDERLPAPDDAGGVLDRSATIRRLRIQNDASFLEERRSVVQDASTGPASATPRGVSDGVLG